MSTKHLIARRFCVFVFLLFVGGRFAHLGKVCCCSQHLHTRARYDKFCIICCLFRIMRETYFQESYQKQTSVQIHKFNQL